MNTLNVDGTNQLGIDDANWLSVTSLTNINNFHILSVDMSGTRITEDNYPPYGILARDSSNNDYHAYLVLNPNNTNTTYLARGIRLQYRLSNNVLQVKTRSLVQGNGIRPPELITSTNSYNSYGTPNLHNATIEVYVKSFDYVIATNSGTYNSNSTLTTDWVTVISNYTETLDKFHIIKGTLTGTNIPTYKSDCIIVRESSDTTNFQLYSVLQQANSTETICGIRLKFRINSSNDLQVRIARTIVEVQGIDPGKESTTFTSVGQTNLDKINVASFEWVIGRKIGFNK